MVNVPKRVIKNQTSDESSNEHNHINAAATKMIIRIGSCAIVIINIASGGPKAKKTPPKNSGTVIMYDEWFCMELIKMDYWWAS